MKMTVIFGFFVIFLASSLQLTLAFETEQEPEPPQIPEPTPEPEPIRTPDPVPVPDPFPGETESEKIQRLTKENNELKQQNINLEVEISTLKNEKSILQAEILELNDTIQNLKELTMEQVRVIMDLANRLKDVLFEKILSATINL